MRTYFTAQVEYLAGYSPGPRPPFPAQGLGHESYQICPDSRFADNFAVTQASRLRSRASYAACSRRSRQAARHTWC